MTMIDLVVVASRQIVRTRRRYRAPVIGATLGIAALIIVYTLGDLVEKSVGSNLSLLGSATLVKVTLPLISLEYPDDPRRFSEKDLKDIESIPGVIVVSPSVYSWWPTKLYFDATYGRREYLNVRVMGVDSSFFRLTAHVPIKQGRSITDADERHIRDVCVIGDDVRDWLFPNKVSPLGAQVIVDGTGYEVVGALGQCDDSIFDEAILLPISVATKKIPGLSAIRRITVLPKDVYSVEDVHARVDELLKKNKPMYKYTLYYDRERVSVIKNIMFIFGLFVVAAVIATFVLSEIGVVNVMLSMVRERNYEIGLRKAVGASDLDIIEQFICESVVVGLVSSAVGILLGSVVVVTVAAIALDFAFDMQKYQLAVVAAVLAGGIAGVASGVLPAIAAARLDPLVAMRAE